MYVLLRVALDNDAFIAKPGKIKEQISKMVAEGLRVKLTPMGITGLSFLEADFFPGSEDRPLEIDWEPKYLYIPSKPALMTKVGQSVDRLTRQLDQIDLVQIADNIERVTSNLNVAVTEGFVPVLQGVEERLEAMAGTLETLDKIMQMVAGEVPPIMANVRDASDRLPLVGENLSTATECLPRISTNLTSAVSQLQLLIEENRGDINEIITNIKYITDDAKEFVRMIKKYPGMLLTEPPKKIRE